MTVLRLGSSGAEVVRWQQQLGLPTTGTFDAATEDATRAFQQQHGLIPDGVVGPKTLAVQSNVFGDHPSDYGPLRNPAAVYGAFKYLPHPIAGMPENIRIQGNWAAVNIVSVALPRIGDVPGGASRVLVHRLVAEPIRQLFDAWDVAGLLPLILSWGGSYCPRFIRGNPSVLSQHAYGSAFDINVAWNWLACEPAALGTKGSVRELVPIAREQHWWWGGWGWPPAYNRKDGMHFEWTGAIGSK